LGFLVQRGAEGDIEEKTYCTFFLKEDPRKIGRELKEVILQIGSGMRQSLRSGKFTKKKKSSVGL